MLHKNVINNTKCISERKLSLKSSKCEKCVGIRENSEIYFRTKCQGKFCKKNCEKKKIEVNTSIDIVTACVIRGKFVYR